MTQNAQWFVAGVTAYEAQKFQEAREHFALGVTNDPNCALAWNALGVVALQLDDLQAAREALTRAIEIDGENVDYLVNAAQVHRRMSEFDSAEQLLVRAEAIHPGHVSIHIVRAQLCMDLGRRDEAKSELLQALRTMPSHREIYARLGQLMRPLSAIEKREWLVEMALIPGLTSDGLLIVVDGWLLDRHPDQAEIELSRQIIQRLLPNGLSTDMAHVAVYWLSRLGAQLGDFDAAERFARLAIPQRMHGYLLLSEALFEKHRRDEVSIFRFDTLDLPQTELRTYRNREQVEGLEQIDPDGGPLFFCCGDAKYFHRYSIAQLLSLHETSPQLDVHIHVVDPIEDTLADCQRLREICSSRRVTFSFEHTDERRKELQRVYYACVRYCVAAEMRRLLRRPIVVTDADMLVRVDLNSLLDSCLNSDVALVAFPFNIYANRYSAALVAYHSTPSALRFAEYVEAMIVQNLFGPTPTWLLDQAAIYCSAATLERRGELRLHRWSSETFTNRWTDKVPIWVETITHKSGNNAFTRARHALLRKYDFDIPRLERYPIEV